MEDPVRVDRWLWAARLFKTRSLAVEAVRGGSVHLNGESVKPGKEVRPGDRLEVTRGPVRLGLVVLATSARRGPASEAALLYEETPESREARERHAAQSRLLRPPGVQQGGPRPTKRDRRRLERAPGWRRGHG